MPRFLVSVSEVLSRDVVVEATDSNEAENIALQAYRDEKIILTSDDFNDDVEITALEQSVPEDFKTDFK